jgi:hypothetical protein
MMSVNSGPLPTSQLVVQPLTNLSEASEFLKRHEETSQFLINNLREYGPTLGDFPYSGNYKVIRHQEELVGVFCLSRSGNLYAQTIKFDCTETILKSCESEPFPIKGFLGPWDVLNALFQKHSQQHPSFKASYASKEILYRLETKPTDPRLVYHSEVRLLSLGDFDDWLPLRMSYLTELGLGSDHNPQQLKQRFEKSTRQKLWWGLYQQDQLVSMAGLNSSGDLVGQVGGVFTKTELRKKGLSKATMLHMLKDCVRIHGHQKSILFTGETDIAAQKLYESIGYDRIGHFALILS